MRSHGIMYHHFYDNFKHIKGQGAISAKELEDMLDYLSERYMILNADEWKTKVLHGNLRENEICITFDDTLKCQFDIAYPILRSRGITAFWFVFSSVLEGNIEMLEAYRHFRTSKFKDVEEFYDEFFKLLLENQNELKMDFEKGIREFNPDKYLEAFPFYTNNDKLFRYFRDIVLKPEKYNYFMKLMLDKHNYSVDRSKTILWMNSENIKELYDAGHVIGVHSHTHPTVIADFSYQEQLYEYKRCKEILRDILGHDVDCVSHPCNSYNNDTLKILSELGIRLGFRSNMVEGYSSLLEKPREDHANIVREMKLLLDNTKDKLNDFPPKSNDYLKVVDK